MNRCDVCLDKNCDKMYKCNCETCNHLSSCNRFIKPTIRITTKCTQSCSHCCFACSPQSTEMMSVETAKNIAQFLKNNDILYINLMGGEFFLNRAWYSIFKMLINEVAVARIVSNGDWANHEPTKKKLLKLRDEFGQKFKISISCDKWHTNSNVKAAGMFCHQNGIRYNVATPEDNTKELGLVPTGRADGTVGFYSFLGAYCNNTEYKYSLLINEMGEIYKCSFGVWKYANVSEYKSGGFNKRFKSVNMKFYDMPVGSCGKCIMQARMRNKIDKAASRLV